jgi:hypothetical protein
MEISYGIHVQGDYEEKKKKTNIRIYFRYATWQLTSLQDFVSYLPLILAVQAPMQETFEENFDIFKFISSKPTYR